MPLNDEQRSLLQLLLSGQSYDDIASLLGVGSDEVRSRARAALGEMGGSDPDAQVAVSDYLLGKADPIGRADAVRHLQQDPDANALATNLVTQLRLLAPGAELPEVPAPKGSRRAAPEPAARPSGAESDSEPAATGFPAGPGGARPPADPRRRQIIVALAALAALVVAVLLVVLVFADGDGDGAGDQTQASDAAGTQAADALTIVALEPLSGGSEASGQAVFAQTQDQPLLQINLTGLEPAGRDQTYIVWLYNSPRLAFPLARDEVSADGSLTGAAAIPNEVVPLLGQFGCVDVSLASNEATQAALQQAVDGQTLPRHSGETVLRGQVPAAPGETAPSGADSVCDIAPAGGSGGDGSG
jgi:hypothetical protein